jgi:hypothetical protein
VVAAWPRITLRVSPAPETGLTAAASHVLAEADISCEPIASGIPLADVVVRPALPERRGTRSEAVAGHVRICRCECLATRMLCVIASRNACAA